LSIAEPMIPRRVLRLPSLVALFAINIGCSSGSPRVAAGNGSNWPAGAALPQPPTDIPESVRSKLVALAQDVATALCDRAAPCCASLNTPLGNNCVIYASVVWASADMSKGSSTPDSTIEYAFDESRATGCRDYLTQLESGCGFAFVHSNSLNVDAMSMLLSYCMASLSVTISGQPWQCMSDTDCIAYGDGLACADAKCVDKADVGTTCQASNADAGTSACVTKLAVNDACSTASGPSCAAGLVCQGSVCVPLPREGEACASASCDEYLHCVPSSASDPTGAGICQALGPRGQVPCTESWQCDHECVSGYCDPRADAFCVSPY